MSKKIKSAKADTKKRFHFSLLDDENGSIPSGNITFVMAFLIPVIIWLHCIMCATFSHLVQTAICVLICIISMHRFFRNSGIKSEAAKA